ncbi:Zn-ribbon domain-containing OB-fold protein [Chloroflexi bacterium TSY]|nr:Zn-ribbon domain-containing OB-fold protein [Chloroflexi bacterium TSY]
MTTADLEPTRKVVVRPTSLSSKNASSQSFSDKHREKERIRHGIESVTFMPTVTNKLEQFTSEDPLGRTPDPWANFREIEILELEWVQKYRHSLGKYSKFFLELENGRFFATLCPSCGKVYAPPRPACPDDLTITEWTELSGRGEVVSWSVLHYAPKMLDWLETPYVLVYVKLEGADTLFAHLLQNYDNLYELYYGMKVRVVYEENEVSHPILLMRFEPITTADSGK